MTDKDTSTDAPDPTHRISTKEVHERVNLLMMVAGMGFNHSQFTCSQCGAAVSVSKKKAAKLRKRKRVVILCKKCKKALKARRRR